MRLILLTLLLLPIVTVGQIASNFSSTSSTDNHGETPYDDLLAINETYPVTDEFGLKEEPASVKIHPNPSSIDLYVTLTGSGKSGKVIVYDILGNIIFEGEAFEMSGGSTTWSHNVSSWHSGTYVVRVLQDDSVVKSLRFIKN